MIHLTPRLQAVASLVDAGSVIADIGTDHAYIPAYLIEMGIISKAFACDINEGPLQNAEKTVHAEGIGGVRFVLSDGLKALEGCAFDEIIIAGMGGELIAQILENSPRCKNPAYTFVLQPMTKQSYLRRYLYHEGFEIEKEILEAEKDKIYNIMKVKYVGKSCEISEAFALLGKTKAQPLFEQKRKREIERLKRILISLENKEDSLSQREIIQSIIKEVEVF